MFRYLADYCVPVSEVSGRQHLRSARCHQLSVPRVRRSTIGSVHFLLPDRQSGIHCLIICWIQLQPHKQFRWDLKTYMFAGHSQCQRSRGVHVMHFTNRHLLAYLHDKQPLKQLCHCSLCFILWLSFLDSIAKLSSMVQFVRSYRVKYSHHLPKHSETVHASQGK